jgi:hypothetical protein
MVQESDQIQTRNAIIGAGFALVAAGMATSSGVYSIWKGDDADPRVNATLGLGAGASTVPTFWYFGADVRDQELKKRIQGVDAKSDLTVDAYKALKAADRDFDRATREGDEAAKAKARQSRQESQDRLDDHLVDLARSCS